jgi:YbbR domain-containing protein
MPRQVEVVGPPDRLESIKKVETLPVDITGQQKGKVQIRAEFVQPGDDVRVLQLGPTDVVVEIEEMQLERTIPGIPIEVGERPVQVEPSQAVIAVRGSYRLVKGLTKEQVRVRVDWESSGEEASSFSLSVEVPPELTVLSLEPVQVKVKAATESRKKEKAKTR